MIATQTRERAATIALGAGLVLLIVAALGGTRNNGFVNYDDHDYVTENPQVLGGISAGGVGWAFTTSRSATWQPLTWLSHQLDCQLFGAEGARGHHLVSLLFHIANALLLFVLLARTTRLVWPSAAVAALFAVHPLRVESVAWVSERKDVLYTFFWLLALLGYVRYARRPSPSRYLLAAVPFALSLMAKPMAVTLPFVLLLLDAWPLDRVRWRSGGAENPEPSRRDLPRAGPLRLVAEKLPLLAMAAASSFITLRNARAGGAVTGLEVLPVALRAGNAALAYVQYLGQLFWPRGLAMFYPHPGAGMGWWEALAASALVVAVSAAVLLYFRRAPFLAVGWLWFLGTLVPVIGLVQNGLQARADRYTYVPSIGLFIMLSWSLAAWSEHSRARHAALAVVTTAALLALVFLTRAQVAHWQDSQALAEHALRVTEGNFIAHENLANALARQQEYERSIPHYREAIALHPGTASFHYNLGLALERIGQEDESRRELETALGYEPAHQKARMALAKLLHERGEVDAAVAHYEILLAADPNHVPANVNLGIAYAERGEVAPAATHFARALAADPEHETARRSLLELAADQPEVAVEPLRAANAPLSAAEHAALGMSLAKRGSLPAARKELELALAIDAGLAEAHFGLGNVERLAGRDDMATDHYRRAVELDGGLVPAHLSLADLYAKRGDRQGVIRHAEAVLAREDNADAHLYLARVLLAEGRAAEARPHALAALRLDPNSAEAGAVARQLSLAGSADAAGR